MTSSLERDSEGSQLVSERAVIISKAISVLCYVILKQVGYRALIMKQMWHTVQVINQLTNLRLLTIS